jgi:hypothetical protein
MSLKVFIRIFHSFNWFQIFMICTYYIHKNIIYIYIILQSKVQKIKHWLWLLMVHVSMSAPSPPWSNLKILIWWLVLQLLNLLHVSMSAPSPPQLDLKILIWWLVLRLLMVHVSMTTPSPPWLDLKVLIWWLVCFFTKLL